MMVLYRSNEYHVAKVLNKGNTKYQGSRPNDNETRAAICRNLTEEIEVRPVKNEDQSGITQTELYFVQALML